MFIVNGKNQLGQSIVQDVQASAARNVALCQRRDDAEHIVRLLNGEANVYQSLESVVTTVDALITMIDALLVQIDRLNKPTITERL